MSLCWALLPAISLKPLNDQCLSEQMSPEKRNDLLRFIQKVSKLCAAKPGSVPRASCFHVTSLFPNEERTIPGIKVCLCWTTVCTTPCDGAWARPMSWAGFGQEGSREVIEVGEGAEGCACHQGRWEAREAVSSGDKALTQRLYLCDLAILGPGELFGLLFPFPRVLKDTAQI